MQLRRGGAVYVCTVKWDQKGDDCWSIPVLTSPAHTRVHREAQRERGRERGGRDTVADCTHVTMAAKLTSAGRTNWMIIVIMTVQYWR